MFKCHGFGDSHKTCANEIFTKRFRKTFTGGMRDYRQHCNSEGVKHDVEWLLARNQAILSALTSEANHDGLSKNWHRSSANYPASFPLMAQLKPGFAMTGDALCKSLCRAAIFWKDSSKVLP